MPKTDVGSEEAIVLWIAPTKALAVLGRQSNRSPRFRALKRTSARIAAYRCISARISGRGLLRRGYNRISQRRVVGLAL